MKYCCNINPENKKLTLESDKTYFQINITKDLKYAISRENTILEIINHEYGRFYFYISNSNIPSDFCSEIEKIKKTLE